MNAKSTIRLAVAESSAVAINVVGFGLWLYEDYSADATMLIYTLGAFTAILFTILTVLFVTPSFDPNGPPSQKRRLKVIADFSMIAFFMFGVLAAFIVSFLFLLPGPEAGFDAGMIAIAFLIVLGFQCAEFVFDIIAIRPMSLNLAEKYIYPKGMGQTAVLFDSVFLGVIVALFLGNAWFVVPLFIFKLVIDIGQPIQFFLGKGVSTGN